MYMQFLRKKKISNKGHINNKDEQIKKQHQFTNTFQYVCRLTESANNNIKTATAATTATRETI